MSEYWKSTPKYWCKHCKTFVRDKKLEKTNHEATAKHQGNIKRFLRDLHRGHEREERDKDRAKNEVERLNGVVSGASPSTRVTSQHDRPQAALLNSSMKEATPAERKAQLARLAEMGVAVPEDYRREVAMAGDWQTIAERPVFDNVKKTEDLDDFKDFKPDPTLNVGVRKRRLEGQEDEEDAGTPAIRKGWGSTIRRYPVSADDGNDDLDALLNRKSSPDQRKRHETEPSSLPLDLKSQPDLHNRSLIENESKPLSIKREESEHLDFGSALQQDDSSINAVKQEGEDPESTVIFKKRRTKSSKTS
ncbi:MAG: hypothetical protein Q9219_004403 [cf. Caloplaca sp. 3 TL-2023]